MADVRAILGFAELYAVTATFKYDNTIVYSANHYDLGNMSAQTGFAVALVSDSTVGLGSSGGYPLGTLQRVESDGFCTVLVGTVCAFPYLGGSVPTVGRGVFVDGAGNAMQASGGSRTAAEKGTVLALDTTNHIAYVLMF